MCFCKRRLEMWQTRHDSLYALMMGVVMSAGDRNYTAGSFQKFDCCFGTEDDTPARPNINSCISHLYMFILVSWLAVDEA
ncbi:uncharacterized protein PHALS_15445 [Plasmopara halstedii]|uniref:Uncharacterized protein n=1 Tax=Plasmopara halstedii TaxID=4781 RepID=A0A0P1AIF3_PLAHL|nr:uncharacterized protein PHALS_15445 [Plasmopara halstedii]CEG40317.1 hypothetical protein PHALS_15445 [Plasmopara halstedii]|eukprot:XP_024576686.1 hypothetical protein PHALS_15445 [Plasmopara halstedii]